MGQTPCNRKVETINNHPKTIHYTQWVHFTSPTMHNVVCTRGQAPLCREGFSEIAYGDC